MAIDGVPMKRFVSASTRAAVVSAASRQQANSLSHNILMEESSYEIQVSRFCPCPYLYHRGLRAGMAAVGAERPAQHPIVDPWSSLEPEPRQHRLRPAGPGHAGPERWRAPRPLPGTAGRRQ